MTDPISCSVLTPKLQWMVARLKLVNFLMEVGQVPTEKGGQELDLPTQEACCIPFPALSRGLFLQGQDHKDA